MKEHYYKDINNSRITKSLNYYKKKFRDDKNANDILYNEKFTNCEKLKEIKIFNFNKKMQML